MASILGLGKLFEWLKVQRAMTSDLGDLMGMNLSRSIIMDNTSFSSIKSNSDFGILKFHKFNANTKVEAGDEIKISVVVEDKDNKTLSTHIIYSGWISQTCPVIDLPLHFVTTVSKHVSIGNLKWYINGVDKNNDFATATVELSDSYYQMKTFHDKYDEY